MTIIRTSERTTFKECRQKWYWSYVDQLAPKRATVGTALRFGTLVHQSLAAYYRPGRKRGPHPARTYAALYGAQIAEGMPAMIIKEEDEYDPKYIDPIDFGVGILEHYICVYGKDERYEILQPEQAFQLDIQHPKTGKYLFTYVSEMDAVVRDLQTRKVGLFEHKTSATLEPFGAPLTLDEQASAYWTFGSMWLEATGKIKRGEDLDFMLYNFIRKALPDTRPRNEEGQYLNQNGTVSKRQPPPYFRREQVMRGQPEREIVFRRALNEFREMQMVKKGHLAVYKSPGKHCGFCTFRDLCEVHETGSDWEAMRDGLFEHWDPYEAHR